MAERFTLERTGRALLMAAALVVCLSPLQAQTAEARVIQQLGQVSCMKDAHAYAEMLSVGGIVKPQWIIVTGPDGYAQFQVSDGSTFEVFSNARVIFRPTMGNWRDLLNVWIGRVKVMIQHEPNKPNPNEVSSPTAVISVRGTIFDVVVEDDDGTTLVTVDEGVVGVRNLTAAGEGVSLHQGDYVRVFRNQPLVPPRADHGNLIRQLLDKGREAIWVAIQNQPVGGNRIPGAGGGSVPGGPNGDKKPPTTGPGAPTSGPGSPTSGPGSPSSGPGGGGN